MTRPMRPRSEAAQPHDPDEAATEDPRLVDAVRELLLACDLDLSHKDLTSTPTRVARLWATSFLSGYAMDPAAILGDPVLGEAQTEVVVIRDLPYHGMCPHHLLPYTGKATVAYLPRDKLVGFGRLGELVRCYTQRLTLQERACNDIVDALMTHLDARGAGCVMVGAHTCLRIPEDKHDATVVTSSFRGDMKGRPELQDRLM